MGKVFVDETHCFDGHVITPRRCSSSVVNWSLLDIKSKCGLTKRFTINALVMMGLLMRIVAAVNPQMYTDGKMRKVAQHFPRFFLFSAAQWQVEV